jgi:hypothetical protein
MKIGAFCFCGWGWAAGENPVVRQNGRKAVFVCVIRKMFFFQPLSGA